ncbi:hypothetical protein MNB_SV-15-178 [hydrothermal vent metagenome]|uniref:Uncharacterized protein n=1 Tax=hydrothermal vent metagenome TaxID=652676 RepID=A0A1W1EJH6_9ZZZZ
MQPQDIKPDTKLCTIIGYNAQTDNYRKYFNKIMKIYNINATAIALNIQDEHLPITLNSVANSKVKEMIVQREFGLSAIEYCHSSNSSENIDIIEVIDGKVIGRNLDKELEELRDVSLWDTQELLIAKMILVASRWYNTPIDFDIIPLLMRKD